MPPGLLRGLAIILSALMFCLSVCDDRKFCISSPLSHVFKNQKLGSKIKDA